MSEYIPESIKKQMAYIDSIERREHPCVLCHKPVSIKSIEEHGGCHHCEADIEIRTLFFGDDVCVLKKPLEKTI